ncbi:hypothetical protein SO802_007695 [Lithocarpus litseifolius]|uniref:POX domain-containing protein n=1 Tax=Lithocarpus litseifolius TaxID=425828 RepID=A0AAW2DS08_9ROSI
MATYFPNVSNQRDCLQTQYLANQKFASYSKAPFHPNSIMMYMNQASSGSYLDILSGNSLPPNCDESVGGRNEMMFIPPIDNRESMQSIDARLNAVTECLLSGFPGGNHNTTKPEALCNPHSSINPKEMLCDQYLYEPSAFATTILNSRYLKASQQFLDEVVNVRKALKQRGLYKHQIQGTGLDVSKEADGRSNTQSVQMSANPGESTTNSSCELSLAERQDIQNKKTTLLSM